MSKREWPLLALALDPDTARVHGKPVPTRQDGWHEPSPEDRAKGITKAYDGRFDSLAMHGVVVEDMGREFRFTTKPLLCDVFEPERIIVPSTIARCFVKSLKFRDTECLMAPWVRWGVDVRDLSEVSYADSTKRYFSLPKVMTKGESLTLVVEPITPMKVFEAIFIGQADGDWESIHREEDEIVRRAHDRAKERTR